jgi:hypothetical protein
VAGDNWRTPEEWAERARRAQNGERLTAVGPRDFLTLAWAAISFDIAPADLRIFVRTSYRMGRWALVYFHIAWVCGLLELFGGPPGLVEWRSVEPPLRFVLEVQMDELQKAYCESERSSAQRRAAILALREAQRQYRTLTHEPYKLRLCEDL